MAVTSVHLADGRVTSVARRGRRHGRPLLYFHSPATAGEEVEGAGEAAALEAGIELITIVRPSVTDDAARDSFLATVASDARLLVEALALGPVTVLGWSGGAPFALAAALHLGSEVTSVHLVSPVPGPLVGPDAVPGQSERLQQIAATAPDSPWASAPGALRDYSAIVHTWPFDVRDIAQQVAIWAPSDDEIVPPSLVDHLARQLRQAEVITGPGTHAWLMDHWATVFRRIVAP